MATSLPESAAELKRLMHSLDRIVLEKALKWARRYYKAVVEKVDEALAAEREAGLVVVHRREVWYQTFLGSVRVARRQYRDRQGKYRCLLDELVGMAAYSHVTPAVSEASLELAAMMPYRRAAAALRKVSAIDLPHQTIWRLMGKAADPHVAQEAQKRGWLLQTGELPESQDKVVARLMVEADGVMLALQGEKERKAEVKLGIAYEGWAKVGKNRYRTVNKTAFATVGSGAAFWAGMTLKLHEKYDLSRVTQTIVGGDGAWWVKDGAGYVHGQFQLDRYHLHRELCAALGPDQTTRGMVWQACESGAVDVALGILDEARHRAKGEAAQRIARVRHYIEDNRSGLGDYRLALGEAGKALRRTGAMEGNVDKLVARRMKNQGMSWTIKGIKRLLCIRFLVLEGKLGEWLNNGRGPDNTPKLRRTQLRRTLNRLLNQDSGAWLQAALPALDGPHASRPWALALKTLAGAPSL